MNHFLPSDQPRQIRPEGQPLKESENYLRKGSNDEKVDLTLKDITCIETAYGHYLRRTFKYDLFITGKPEPVHGRFVVPYLIQDNLEEHINNELKHLVNQVEREEHNRVWMIEKTGECYR